MRRAIGFSRGKAAYERDWTKGSIINNLLSLSWPMTVISGIMLLGPTIDVIWVGKLGTSAIAGVGVASIVVMVMNTLITGFFTGLRAMVARFIGAGDVINANHVSQQAFVIGIAFSAIMAIIGVSLAKQILILMGLEADAVGEGAAYMRIQLLGVITMSFMAVSQSIMQASGDAVTPMKISIGSRLLHMAVCPFLVLGWWIFPRLGVRGAALASVISQVVGGVIMLWILLTGRTRLRLSFKGFHFDPGIIWRIVKIGIPAAIHGTQRSVNQLIMVRFMAVFGTLAVAAHTLHQRIHMVVIVPSTGVGQASGVLAGQNLGADQPERAQKTGWLAAGIVEIIMVICAVVIWFWPESIVQIFNSEPSLVALTSTFLKIAVPMILIIDFTLTLMQCLVGAGDTMPPMVVSIMTFWMVQLPLAYYLPKITDLGVYGIRWAIVAAAFFQTISFTPYFWAGRWKHKKV